MRIVLSKSYYRALKVFVKGNKSNAENVKKVLNLLKENPKHPSLNLEKLSGFDVWTIRIDRGNRIFFHFSESDIVVLVDIGKHDKYRKY